MSSDTKSRVHVTGHELNLPEVETTRSASIAARWDALDRTVSDLRRDTVEGRNSTAQDHLQALQTEMARRSIVDVLNFLMDEGMSWRDVARLVGVSVPAIKKWRTNAGISGANRSRLARVAALVEFLRRNLISDVPSWLEMPVADGVQLSAMELLVAGRYDLVLELSRIDGYDDQVAEVLGKFDPEWRDHYYDRTFDVVWDDEGNSAIVPKDHHVLG